MNQPIVGVQAMDALAQPNVHKNCRVGTGFWGGQIPKKCCSLITWKLRSLDVKQAEWKTYMIFRIVLERVQSTLRQYTRIRIYYLCPEINAAFHFSVEKFWHFAKTSWHSNLAMNTID
jgi:hypothetical protein